MEVNKRNIDMPDDKGKLLLFQIQRRKGKNLPFMFYKVLVQSFYLKVMQ